MSAVEVSVCDACGHAVYPPRLACPRCHAREWRPQRADLGTVVEVTTVRRSAVNGPDDPPIELALVRADAGPLLLARLDGGPLEPGTRVALAGSGGAVTATPAQAARGPRSPGSPTS